MTQEEILEGNKLIAAFCMIERLIDDRFLFIEPEHVLKLKMNWYKVNELKYHSSWDWIIPVVEKIEKMCNYEKDKSFFSVESFSISWSRSYPSFSTSARILICTKFNGSGSEFKSIQSESRLKIEAVWLACIDLIKWYNQNKIDNN